MSKHEETRRWGVPPSSLREPQRRLFDTDALRPAQDAGYCNREYYPAFAKVLRPIALTRAPPRLAAKYVIAYVVVMRTTSYSDLRRNLADTIDGVDADHEPVMITRDRGTPAAVLISVEDFASLEETAYLLRSPRNAERLLEAIADLEGGGGTERQLSG